MYIFHKPTHQTIYSTLLDAMRLKVPELIRRFDDNLRPKESNSSIVRWTLLRPKASNLRRIQYDSELKRPKASIKRRIYRFGIKASKSVDKLFAGQIKHEHYHSHYDSGNFNMLDIINLNI